MRKPIHYLAISFVVLIILVNLAGCASTRTQGAVQADEYRRMQEKQKAEMSLEQVITQKLPEMTAEECEHLGDRYLSQGNMDMAFIYYQKALYADPKQVRYRYKVGYLFLERGMGKEAQAEFQEILKTDPAYAAAYEGLGRVSFHLGDLEGAESHFLKSLSLHAGSWQTHNYLGIVYDRQNRLDEAIEKFKKAISMKPNEPLLYNNLGMSLLRRGENSQAARAFQEALQVGEPHPKIYNNLALALCKLGKYTEALEVLKRSGDEASAYYHLGCIYLASKKYREAIDAFDRTIELSPSFHVKAYEKKQQAKVALSVLQ